MAKCAAIKADGTRCQAQAMSSDDKCYTHSPKTAAARQRTNQRGGRTGGRGRPKVRVDEVYKLADKQIESLTDRSVDPKRSAVMAQWAHIKLRAAETERKLIEHAELEEKVAQLETMFRGRDRQTNSDDPYSSGGWSYW